MSGQGDQPASRKLFYLGRGLLFFIGVSVGTFAFLLATSVIAGHPAKETVLSAHGVLVDSPKADLTKEQMAHLSDLIQGGHVLTGQNLVSELSRYYSGVINTLLFAFTGLGIVAFFSVRGLSIDRAEDTARDASRRRVDTYFQSKEFHDASERIIKNATADLTDSMRHALADFEYHREAFEDMEDLRERLARLEATVARLPESDQDDDSSSDTLGDPGE